LGTLRLYGLRHQELLPITFQLSLERSFPSRRFSYQFFQPLEPQKVAALGRQSLVFYLSGVVGIAATLLQLYNAVVLNAFWPFFTAIVLQLIGAMFQFARMILRPPEEQ
jgi:hypothetical protein